MKRCLLILALLVFTSDIYAGEDGTQLTTMRRKIPVNQCKAYIRVIEDALEKFQSRYERFPTTSEGLQILVIKNFLEKKYLNDPWDIPFDYKYVSKKKCYLRSIGPDKTGETMDDVNSYKYHWPNK